MAALVLIETLLLGALVYLAWQRSRPASPPFAREMLFIALLIVLQGAAQAAHFLISEQNRVVGFSFAMQAIRAAALIAALALWFRLVRWQMPPRRGIVIATIAALAVAFARGPLAVAGAVTLFLVGSKLRWPEEVHGVRRVLAILLGPAFFALMVLQTQTILEGADGSTLVTLGQTRPALLTGDLSPGQSLEMQLAGPLDRVVEMCLAILRAQVFFVFFKLLTLPVRLQGLSLKRRFMVNYFFIRLIPAMLSTITLALVIYFGYGLYRVAQVRRDLATTADRAFDFAVHLSESNELRATLPDPRELRAWVGPEGGRSHVVIQHASEDSLAIESTTGTPEALLSDSLFAQVDADSAAGLVVAGRRLYLAGEYRRAGGDIVRVAVPLDSVYLARVARRAGVDVQLSVLPGLFIGSTEVRSAGDTTWTGERIAVAALNRSDRRPGRLLHKPRYLGRAFLPAGNWQNLSFKGLRGAVQLTVETAPADFRFGSEQTALVLTTNAWTIFFLIVMVIVVALTESLAVRTGRGIVTAILDEVVGLRDAVLRIGRGDLDHRIPVQGKDEIAALAAAVNQMAADLKRQQAEIVEKERLEADLLLAREIQQRFLPQAAPVIAGLDVAGVSIPSREVGGDLFYFLPLETGRLGVALGDVSGKSVPAALLMSNVLAALRTEARLHADINDSLGRLNELIVEQVEPGRFVTLFYGVVDSAAGEIRYASAGHNPPLQVSTDGKVSWLDEAGVPLGVLPEVRYGSRTISFRPGDVLVLYSDGITEAMRLKPELKAAGRRIDPASPPVEDDVEFYDEERLAQVVTKSRSKSASEIVAAILDSVHQFAAGTPQADDMTLVVIRMKPTRPGAS